MKALVVHPGPSFSVADVHRNIVAGLQANGVEVASFNLDDRLDFYSQAKLERNGEFVDAFNIDAAVQLTAQGLEAACYRWWPDVVILVSGFFVPPSTLGVLARRPHHVVLWCTEAPYEDDRHQRVARYVDTVVVNDPATLDAYRAVNPRTWYLPHMWDPEIHREGTGARPVDLTWVGTAFESRIEFFEACDFAGLRVHLGGNWQQLPEGHHLEQYLVNERGHCLGNTDTADMYRKSKASMNWYRKETSEYGTADGWALGPREVELAATGTFFLRESRGEGDELFPMLPTFTTPEEFSDKLRWWATHDSQRESAAAAARAAVVDRSNATVMAGFCRLVDGVGKVFHPTITAA